MARPTVPRPRRLVRALVGLAGTLAVSASLTLITTAPAPAAPSASDLQQQINKKARDLDQVIERYNELKVTLDRTKAKAAKAADKVKALAAQTEQARAAVDELAVKAYEGGAISRFSALLRSGSPDAFVDRLDALDALARNRQHDLDQVEAAAAALADQKADLDALVAKQTNQQTTLTDKKASIEKQLADLKEQQAQLRQQALATTADSDPGAQAAATPPYVAGRAQKVVDYAYAQLGKPYVFGAAGPDAFDCSGLTMMAWAQVGVHLAHAAHIQMDEQTTRIPRSELRPGDLVFFYGGEHVALYVGNNSVIQAPQPGEVVKISTIDWIGHYTASGRPG